LKISLILPLFDRRTAGWRQLESALAQTLPRHQYEIVVVVGQPQSGEAATDAHAEALLRRCDAVVRVAEDPDRPEQEVPLLMAAYARSTGDLLFFMEGHTELAPDCCAMIAAHFRDNSQSRIAWAPRIHHHTSPLGFLIGMHSLCHERRAHERGGFWLGANSIITREYFEHLGRLDADYMRFCERVLSDRILRENVPIARIAKPLAVHHDDMPLAQLIGVATAAGAAKYRYYTAPAAGASMVRVRHPIYLAANHAAFSLVLYPVACMLREGLLRAAMALARTAGELAYRLYLLGFGFADLSGYCRARIRALRAQDPRDVPLSRDARRS
jgi:hypothetical protein